MLKNRAGYCPKCGGIWDVLTDGVEFTSEDYIKVHHKCGCGAEWDEYYYAQYTGYAYENKDYDEDGEEQVYGMIKEEVAHATFCQEHDCETCPYSEATDCMVAFLNDRAGIDPDEIND